GALIILDQTDIVRNRWKIVCIDRHAMSPRPASAITSIVPILPENKYPSQAIKAARDILPNRWIRMFCKDSRKMSNDG
ncbi:MAG: hypothetical protein FWG74_07390, partial [Planctomycetes bacterium]|nr:hypothetical protein [Planctomycetota bacterium]